jgi:hypothetical protein
LGQQKRKKQESNLLQVQREAFWHRPLHQMLEERGHKEPTTATRDKQRTELPSSVRKQNQREH